MMRVILHEAGHTADVLLGAQAADFEGEWGMKPRMLAARTIERVRLEGGLRGEWTRVHQSFEKVDWAWSHVGGGEGPDSSAREISEGGFMSSYGATSVPDDIAEMVAYTYMSGPFLQAGLGDGTPNKRDLACQEMRKHGEKDLPSRLAAVYTKLLFLQDLGLVAEEDVETCTGPDLGLPIESSGFDLWHEGNKLRSFARNVTAAIGTQADGDRVFEMKGDGEAGFRDRMYPASVRLQLDLEKPDVPIHQVPWPRGVYPLGLFGDNNVELRLDGAPFGNFDAFDGYALVAEASNDRIAGSIFLERVVRVQAFSVFERYDPPLVIRFRIEH